MNITNEMVEAACDVLADIDGTGWRAMNEAARKAYRKDVTRILEAALAGKAVVPVEPTEAMIEAAADFHANGKWHVGDNSFFGGMYRAMIAAGQGAR